MKYLKPLLYNDKNRFNFSAVCASGMEPSVLGCKNGPEANSGCGSGAAAFVYCLPGSAAGNKCESGAGFD